MAGRYPKFKRTRRVTHLRKEVIGFLAHINEIKQLRTWKQVKEDYNPRHSHRPTLVVRRSLRARLDAWWTQTEPRQWQVREKVSRG